MPGNIVSIMQENINNAYNLTAKFIEVCPENIWNETSGGWPVWQQVYHTANVFNLFADLPGEASISLPFDMEIGRLVKVAQAPCQKAIIADFLTQAKARADKYVNSLSDEKLLEKNTPFSALKGADVPHITVLTLLVSHTLYHLGSCDAALRNHGLKGVF